MKVVWRIFGCIGMTVVALAATAGLLHLACNMTSDVSVLQRERSPDGKFDLVHVIVSGGGAAGWVLHSVYIAPAGRPISEGSLVARLDLEELRLRWLRADEAVIEAMGDVRISYFDDLTYAAPPFAGLHVRMVTDPEDVNREEMP